MPGMADPGCPRTADQGPGRPVTPRPRAGGAGGDAGGHRHVRHGRRGLIEAAPVCGQLGGRADPQGMGWFNRDTYAGAAEMTPEDRRDFTRFDETVALATRAAKVVIEGGRALKAIRDRQLFRTVCGTWDEYLKRHGLTRRRADQMVAAAGVLDAVSEAVQSEIGTAVPDLSERAVRPLVGLAKDEAAKVVIEAARTADGITPATIRKAAGRRRKATARAARPVRIRVPGWVVVATPNRKASGGVREALEAAVRQLDMPAEEAA